MSPGGGGPGGGGATLTGDLTLLVCPTCGYPREADTMFCESCGYDFQTGELPAAPTVTPAAPTGSAQPPVGPVQPPGGSAQPPGGPAQPSAGSVPPLGGSGAASTDRAGAPAGAGDPGSAGVPSGATVTPGAWWATVEADRDYYDRLSAGGPVDFPDQPPVPQSIPLLSATVAVGRRSRSRGTAPEIDLSGPPEDPAVSHAHARLLRQQDGSYAVVDAGSTNGTRVNDEEDPLPVNAPRPLASGDRIYVGAWSRVTIEQR